MKKFMMVFLVGGLLASGCSKDNPTEILPPPPGFITPPTTCDLLMENFEDIYSIMLISEFGEMLHPDFQYILSTGTIADWGLAPGAVFDFETMMGIHYNMFGGSAGTDHSGNGVSPLDRIEISVIERIADWVVLPDTDPEFPGTSRALYEIKIFFHDNTGTHAFAVNQQALFYASSVDGIWYLQGMRNLNYSQGKDSEAYQFDAVLAIFR